MLGRLGQVASSVLDRLGVTREEDSWELVTDPGPEVPELAAEVASATAASGAEFRAANFVPTIDFVEEEAGALFASDTNTALGEWHFERLAGLEADPDFPSPGVARARLARAVRAGLGARYKLDRRARTTCKSPHVPGIKRWYVVLRSRDFPEGFITEDYAVYCREVQSTGSGRIGFDPQSVSHSFTTLAEVVAFLAGAQRGWPQVEL